MGSETESLSRRNAARCNASYVPIFLSLNDVGAFIVSGPVELKDADGNVYPAKATGSLTLRRFNDQAVL